MPVLGDRLRFRAPQQLQHREQSPRFDCMQAPATSSDITLVRTATSVPSGACADDAALERQMAEQVTYTNPISLTGDPSSLQIGYIAIHLTAAKIW